MGTKVQEQLLSTYEEIMECNNNEPEWAVHKRYEHDKLVKCSIPFVGKNYFQQTGNKFLIYASAEVLTDYYPNSGSDRYWLDSDEIASNRHRWFFDNNEMQTENRKENGFPHVHIQPMNDGALATAAIYIMSKLMNIAEGVDVAALYEMISFGNYGKYTIETGYQRSLRINGCGDPKQKENIDYAGDKSKLAASHDFIVADIQCLKPDYIIIPKRIYTTDKNFINSVKGKAKIIPIYQMNARVINRYIKEKYARFEMDELHPLVRNCYGRLSDNGITGKTKENYRYVFGYLYKVLKDLGLL